MADHTADFDYYIIDENVGRGWDLQDTKPNCPKCFGPENINFVDVVIDTRPAAAVDTYGLTVPIWHCSECRILFPARSREMTSFFHRHCFQESTLSDEVNLDYKHINCGTTFESDLKNFLQSQVNIDPIVKDNIEAIFHKMMISYQDQVQEMKESLDKLMKFYIEEVADPLTQLKRKVSNFEMKIDE